MIKLKIPVEPYEWQELRIINKVKTTDIKRDLGDGFLTYYYRLSKGQRVSYWSALKLAEYLNK